MPVSEAKPTAFVPVLPEMSVEAASAIVGLLQHRAGIAIAAGKTDLLRNRLARRLRALDLPDFDSYLRLLAGPAGGEEMPMMVEALTTHTTAFFRESRQYDWLAAEGLPAMIARSTAERREIVVWSAACSTGPELWSAVMVIEEHGRRRFRPVPYRAIGTDISRQILARAEAAVYGEEEIAGVPEELRRFYFLRSRADRAARDGRPVFRIVPELRARAAFIQANLIALDRAPRIAADIAFLRNVLIYFERRDQARIVRSVADRLRPGGYLLTGHAEALPELPAGLAQIGSSIYQRKEA